MKLVKVRINDSNVPQEYTREGVACYVGNGQHILCNGMGGTWFVNNNQITILGDASPEGASEGSSLRELFGQNVRTLHVEFS